MADCTKRLFFSLIAINGGYFRENLDFHQPHSFFRSFGVLTLVNTIYQERNAACRVTLIPRWSPSFCLRLLLTPSSALLVFGIKGLIKKTNNGSCSWVRSRQARPKVPVGIPPVPRHPCGCMSFLPKHCSVLFFPSGKRCLPLLRVCWCFNQHE